MKKIIASLTLLVWSTVSFALTHTVARGENLESIAAKYNISEAQLIEANPGAAKLFYVGLVLNIPEGLQPSSTDSEVSHSDNALEQSRTNQTKIYETSDTEEVDENPGAVFLSEAEYGFLSKPEGVKGDYYTWAFTIGADYYFMHRNEGLFAGAKIGYNSANSNSSTKIDRFQYLSLTSEAHFITLPINVGYSIASSNRNFAVSPYASLDFNFCVGGKLKAAEGNVKEEYKIKKKVGVAARVGARVRIYSVNLGVSYVIPLNDSQKDYFGEDSYIAISLGFCTDI